jgi:hypothetical protein
MLEALQVTSVEQCEKYENCVEIFILFMTRPKNRTPWRHNKARAMDHEDAAVFLTGLKKGMKHVPLISIILLVYLLHLLLSSLSVPIALQRRVLGPLPESNSVSGQSPQIC